MVTYEVIAEVEPGLAERYERYVRERHVADVMRTGCFVHACLERCSPFRYRVRYVASSTAALDRYLAEHTARLRADFAANFPVGVRLERTQWTEVERWLDGGPAS